MKRYLLYIFFAVAAVVAAGCTEENISEKEEMQSRTDKSEKLTVSFSVAGSPVQSLSFTHNAIVQEVEVNVNNDNLYWNLESNRSWCKVVEAEHKGSGTVTLEIDANEGFEARVPATLTFVAGAYRGLGITVNQTATAFVLSQPFFVAPLAGGPMTVKVTTRTGTAWSYDGGDWITVAENGETSDDDFTVTTLTLTPAVNIDDSRYGRVELSAGAEKDYIYVYQFGTELSYDNDGNIYFPGGEPASITVKAPSFSVKEVQVPAFATGTVTEEGDGTATVTITMEDNLSDCAGVRQMDASLMLSNASATLVALPAVVQDYTPAHGLVTAAGLQAFAKAVAEGTSTEDWEENGVVRVIKDIDMNGVTGWTGIGSEARPFTGKFDGKGFSVINLKNSAHGIFNYCKGATVENITLGKGCAIYSNEEYSGKACFGGVVSVAEGTTVSGCGMTGSLEFGGSSEDDDPLYAGGVVGWADGESTVKSCSMGGTLTLSSSASSMEIYYCGGIAGLCEGSLTSSEVLGKVAYASGVSTAYIGGVQSALVAGAAVANNSFMGTLTLGGSALNAAVGGLYGTLQTGKFDSATDKSVSLGNIEINSFQSNTASCIYAGGFAGKAEMDTDVSFKGYESQTNILLNCGTLFTGKYVFIGGFLGGCDVDNPVVGIAFQDLKNSGAISIPVNTGIAWNVRRNWIGGIAGMVNGPSTFTGCVNNAEIGKSSDGIYCARSNAFNQIIGGIAGYVHGGDASFSNCTNQAALESHMYNNNGISNGTWDGMYTLPSVGGILGAFNYYPSSRESYSLTMQSCTNGKNLFSYRGHTGGIVGYCYNATIDGCTNMGGQNNGINDQCAIRGGIVGGAGNATVKNSVSTGDITSRTYGSADHANTGGIVGLVYGTEASTVDNCSAYGIFKAEKGTADKPNNAGGIVGMGTAATNVTGCRYGGNIQGVDINENNVGVKKNVIGNETGEVTGINYWNGNN